MRPHLKELGPRKYLCSATFRSIHLTATENTCQKLALEGADLRRKPGYFIARMPEGTYYERGLESPDAMVVRLSGELA